eukprot:8017130-Pyramimonas_sp.AAC.1
MGRAPGGVQNERMRHMHLLMKGFYDRQLLKGAPNRFPHLSCKRKIKQAPQAQVQGWHGSAFNSSGRGTRGAVRNYRTDPVVFY